MLDQGTEDNSERPLNVTDRDNGHTAQVPLPSLAFAETSRWFDEAIGTSLASAQEQARCVRR